MNHVDIVAARINTALGNLKETWEGLISGRSALREVEGSHLAQKCVYGQVPGLQGPFGGSRRLQNLLEMTLGDLDIAPETTLIAATTKGAVDELDQDCDLNDQTGQPWNIAAQAAEYLGLRGPRSTISAACASGTLALIQGAARILNGEADTVLVVGLDLLSRFVSVGFNRLKALAPEPCRPFDRERRGLSLGEGCGALLLAAPQKAREEGVRPLARLRAWGASCDATHITAPSRTGVGLIRAIHQAMGGGPEEIGAIQAHGTGTIFNDAMEACAFQDIWGDIPRIYGVKGAIGHCLGAAGVIETAISIKSLENGIIPPTVGLRSPERGIEKALVLEQTAPLEKPAIIKCNSGFGGINAAIRLDTW